LPAVVWMSIALSTVGSVTLVMATMLTVL